ncbi:unnamed protein product [Rotaria sordida]|uniref:F-box domain-containing protein n=2 Tax=Rotaria sordida TaxID=392033 RepID=A0A814XM24_9BILA|nr:unnamed protein product [Rotaria sordida]CAF1307650.1 unnamed protein product [Rotaria sordida]
MINSNKYLLEDLANEILYEIFEYLDSYDIYKGFYNLNKRFQNLAINSNVLTKINISTISKSNFEDYYRNRINFLGLLNPFAADIIFSPLDHILNFVHLETLIIDNIETISFYKFFTYFMNLPNLHSLIISFVEPILEIDYLFAQIFRLSKLKYCKIKYDIQFYTELFYSFTEYVSSPIEKIIKEFFHHVQILHLATYYTGAYLDTQRWQKLIVYHMPYLRVFDINCQDFLEYDISCHDAVTEFNSSFWIKNKCFFVNQYEWNDQSIGGVIFVWSISLHWKIDELLGLHHQQENLNSIEHLHIRNDLKSNCRRYFSSVNRLTIDHLCEISDGDSFITNLNHMVSLKQLTKLVIITFGFTFEHIIKLLRLTPNLHTLEFGESPMWAIDSNVIQQNVPFQYTLTENKIENLVVHGKCSLNRIQFVVYIFSKLKYLKTDITETEIQPIIRYLLSKIHNRTQHLFYLCISHSQKNWLKEVDDLIKLDNLLNNYSIKYIWGDLHLWW